MPELGSKVLIELLTQADTKGIEEAESKMSSFGKSVVTASGVILGAVTAIGAASIPIAIDSLHAYEAQEDAMSRLQTGINNVKTAHDKSITSLLAYDTQLQKTTRFADEQIASGQAMLTTFQLNQGTIKSLTPGMLNMAEAFRKTTGETVDLNQISVLFGKVMGDAPDGIDGMSTALRRMGVIMTDQQKAVFKFGTEQERSATLAGIMDLNFKGFAEGGGKTTSGRLQIMTNQIGEVKEKIGAFIANAIAPMVDKISRDVVPAFEKFTTWLGKNQDVLMVVAGVITAAVIPAIVALTIAMLANPVVLITLAIIALGAAIVALYIAWKTNWNGIQTTIKAAWDFIWNTVLLPMRIEFEILKFALTLLWDFFIIGWAGIALAVGQFGAWFSKTFHPQIEAVHNAIKVSLSAMGAFWKTIWNGIHDTVAGIANKILSTVKNMINGVIGFFNGLISGANNVGGKVPGFAKIPSIPMLAAGTSNFQGGMAWVGEKGPELAILPRGSQVIPNDKLGSTMSGMTINMQNDIHSELDMNAVFRRLAWDLSLN